VDVEAESPGVLQFLLMRRPPAEASSCDSPAPLDIDCYAFRLK
jgi:hypothetical protein